MRIIGLKKPVRDEQIKRHVSSLIKGATLSPLLEAEIITAGGKQGATLIPEQVVANTIRKFNFSCDPFVCTMVEKWSYNS